MRNKKMLIKWFYLFFIYFASSVVAYAEEVAITMDDPNLEPTPMLAPLARDQRILDTLKKNHLKIVLFVRGKYLDNQDGKSLLKRWDDAGHTLANHTFSHPSITEISEKDFESEVMRNEAILKSYSHFKKLFRFPYLKEGDTVETRDAFRKFMSAYGYMNGSVTIDASDWYISERLEVRLKENANADITPYKQYYLHHIWERAQYYDNLAKEVLGRSPKHTLLIHHNLLSALFLNDLIQMFKEKGWKVIDASDAFTDPVFEMQPKTMPAGESLIWALAKQTGRYDDKLRYPGEDESYEKDAMDKLGL